MARAFAVGAGSGFRGPLTSTKEAYMEEDIKKHREILNDHSERLADHAERLKSHERQILSLEMAVRGIHSSIESLRSLFQSAHTLWANIADDVRFHRFVDGLLIVFSIVGLIMLFLLLIKGAG